MNYDIILALQETWLRLSSGQLTEVEPWSKLAGSALLVTDFDQAYVGMHRFDGKPAHAKAIIEKHVRAVGLAEGLTHVVLHHTDRVADGSHCAYTGVPLEAWQRMKQWVSRQSDHCLPVAMGGLYFEGLKKGQARLTRTDRTFHFAGRNDVGIFYASVSAIGNTQDDFKIALQALSGQVRGDRVKGITEPVQWACIRGESLEQEAALAKLYGEFSLSDCQLIEHEKYEAPGKTPLITAIPGLCRHMSLSAALVSPIDRLAWRAESLILPATAMTALAGAVLLASGMWLQSRATDNGQKVAQINSQAEVLESRITAANAIEPPVGFAPVAAFAQQLGDGAAYDPVAMLRLVREAAGQDIRIQRLKLESYADKKRVFRVDGITDKSGLSAISRFLAVTQSAGWRAETLDPAEQQPGAFSYRLIATSQ